MKIIAYIGCYTDEKKEGIQIVELDTDSGALERIGAIQVENATYLVPAGTRPRLYASLRLEGRGGEKGQDNGGVGVFAIEGDALRLLDRRPVGGSVPCHVALDPSESSLVFAEYAGAKAGVFDLEDSGGFSDKPPTTIRHAGHGPDPERQDSAHAHCARVSPDGRHLYVADLGLDRVVAYDFSAHREGLKELPARSIRTAPGAGPRHILFHPNGQLAFLLHELDNTISSFRDNGESMDRIQTVSLLPPGFQGFSKAAAIKISENGRRIFGSNRGHDSIAVFDLDPSNGKISPVRISRLEGSFPRDFEFAPGSNIVLVGHEKSHEIRSYRYIPKSGEIAPAAPPLAMHRPVCIRFGAHRGA